MACGLPVIVTKQAGVSAYIDSCLGFVAENNQPETLAQAMRYLFGAYDRFDPTAISGFAKENFSEDRILSMIEHLYQNAVSRKETV